MATTLAFFISIALVVANTMAAPQSEAATTTSGHARFAADIYKKCAKTSTGNVILSPFSIETALSLASQGANGKTFDALRAGLHLSGNKENIADEYARTQNTVSKSIGSSILNVANKVFVQKGYTIRPTFEEVAVKQYHSEVASVNFSENEKAAKTINDWVEEKTHDKIKNLISSDSLSSDSRLVLVNAIYFKGAWAQKFNPELTREDDFWLTETESKKIQFMNQKNDFLYGVFPEYDATALALKYNNSDISFLVILPNKKDGLAELESKLQDIDLNVLTSKLYKQEVNVKLPKFKIESTFQLKDILTQLKLGNIFDNDADFSGLLDSHEPLKVSEVVHKAFIEVNEEGAEAAAATALFMVGSSLHSYVKPETKFVANHPFYYLILTNVNGAHEAVFNGRFAE